MRKIICFFGQKSNGKTTCSKIFVKFNEDFILRSFADPIKEIYCKTFFVDLEFIEKWKNTDKIPDGFEMPVREGLKFIGEGFRKINKKCWIDLAFKKDEKNLSIGDGRHLNESEEIFKKKGLNVLVYNPEKVNNDEHPSESEILPIVNYLKNYKTGPVNYKNFHYLIKNDGNINKLKKDIEILSCYSKEYFKKVEN